MCEKKAYYQSPEPNYVWIHDEKQASYNLPDDDYCDCCNVGLVEMPTKYGEYKFCQKCYSKISEIIFTPFWEALVKTFGKSMAFELALYVGENHEEKKWQEYLHQMQPLIDKCLIAHRQTPYLTRKAYEKEKSFMFNNEIYIDFSMDFYNLRHG
jgi:hypothetical protein